MRSQKKEVRTGKNWDLFLQKQEQEILARLRRYNNVATIKEQLALTGNLSPYQKYKITIVSPFLRQALRKIRQRTYGTCQDCNNEIPKQRLRLVPAALRCMICENN